ncbi:MAG: DUF4252 domain-containing protein [Haliscomenobacter sp.]|nr:DUF4252 domain-containing protein [Haliscomenobacter sp.]MBK8655574.1 DUF4252 domain-containing protein [Haliscomenobacter sp.]
MRIKPVLFTLLLAGIALSAAAQTDANAIDKYFQQYVNDNRFSVVYISPKLFQMFGKLDVGVLDMDNDTEAQAVMDMIKDLRGLRILTTDENVAEFYKEAKAKINTKEYETLMTVREKDGNQVEFLVRESENKIAELLLLAGGPGADEFVLMSFVGLLDLNKISRLAKEMEK